MYRALISDCPPSTRQISLPVGGRVVVPVVAERRGYLGPIDLAADLLPGGLRLESAQIPAGAMARS